MRERALVVRPTSCRCGGHQAWLLQTEGRGERMIGCVCHTPLSRLVDLMQGQEP